MQMSPLQKQLSSRIQKMRIPVRQLEREAGLKANAITNILRGVSKKPSAESLVSIAKVLECTIEDLLEIQASTAPNQDKKLFKKEDNSLVIENVELFEKASTAVLQMSQTKNRTLTYEKFLFLSREIYNYSLEHSLTEVDERFAGWLIERTLAEVG